MSSLNETVHLPDASIQDVVDAGDGTSSSDDSDDDQTWDDWVEEGGEGCKSLFDDTVLSNAEETLKYDKEKHGFDLAQVCRNLELDTYNRIRLINAIRKQKLTPEQISVLPKPSSSDTLTGLAPGGEIFTSDEFLKPVIPDDPLLQSQDADYWSDEEEDAADESGASDAQKTINALRKKLAISNRALDEYKELVGQRLIGTDTITDVVQDTGPDQPNAAAEKRDDDSHYFESYGENEIHQVMLQDKVRTSTYAHFILTATYPETLAPPPPPPVDDSQDEPSSLPTPISAPPKSSKFPSPPSPTQLQAKSLFQNATVLDIGCGTGILSLFAARAGAKRVIAVDASAKIAEKAKEIIKLNGLEGTITVVGGKKVEDIEVDDMKNLLGEDGADGKVDIIVSEWMGYALLYESMLDSVLVARDKFLKPPTGETNTSGGVIVPSQCKMMLALSDAENVRKERIEFWDDVYGFDLTPMTTGIYNEAIMDVIPEGSILSDAYEIKDLHLPSIPLSHIANGFVSDFQLISKNERLTMMRAFVLWFDCWFVASGKELTDDRQPRLIKPDGGGLLADVWFVGGKSGPLRRESSTSLRRRRSKSREAEARRRASMTHENQGHGHAPTIGEDTVFTEEPQSTVHVEDLETVASFSTGPHSFPTHWKQTVFLLREPFAVTEGSVVHGKFHLRKSETNSRDLDVEIHYEVKHPEDSSLYAKNKKEGKMQGVTVQMFKVR